MKCARCNRPLLSSAVKVGKMSVGPVCAKKMGLSDGKKIRIRKVETVVQEDQLDLFELVK